MGAGEGAPVPVLRECWRKEESWTCFTLPNTVLFNPRLLPSDELLIVCASCFIRGWLLPTARMIEVWTMVGGATVEPSRFVNFTYKFCVSHKQKYI